MGISPALNAILRKTGLTDEQLRRAGVSVLGEQPPRPSGRVSRHGDSPASAPAPKTEPLKAVTPASAISHQPAGAPAASQDTQHTTQLPAARPVESVGHGERPTAIETAVPVALLSWDEISKPDVSGGSPDGRPVPAKAPAQEEQGAQERQSGPAVGTVAQEPIRIDQPQRHRRRRDESVQQNDDRPAEFSDDALALCFSALHGADLRYTAAWGQWCAWNGHAWKPDQTVAVFDLVRKVCRQQSAKCEDARLQSRISSAQTVSAVERMARADRRHAATIDQWDADPWTLNTPGGIVDLRTGELRSPDRMAYMTKTTAVAPGGDCPLWLSFLKRITDSNPELQSFLQRMCGYALTGITREHALFFLFGHGANGKSVFLNVFSGSMGDYARIAPIETFIDSKSERHPTDLAGLQGARLIIAVETEANRKWAESKLKSLTGGDKIAARFMRQDFFEFAPVFKLVIAGNHKPGLRSVDEAMRRRFNLLPFEVTIPPAERDLQLADKLREEWPGILQWAIDGCLAWQSEGLHAPKAVSDATADYLDAEDALARWIEDCTEAKAGAWESATTLFSDWKAWAESSREYAGSQKSFSENLAARGVAQVRTKAARGFGGIRLRAGVATDGGRSVPSNKLLEDTQEEGRFEL